MAAHSEAEANSLLVYKSPAWKGGALYCNGCADSVLWLMNCVSVMEFAPPISCSLLFPAYPKLLCASSRLEPVVISPAVSDSAARNVSMSLGHLPLALSVVPRLSAS